MSAPNSRFLNRTASLALLALGCLSLPGAVARAAVNPRPLQIYFIDVEGGQSTLFVTPAGDSLLIDTGWPGNEGRDANRIVAAAHSAGLNRIDYVLLTHYHIDHAGGIAQLAAKMPIGAVIDHGENREHAEVATEQAWLTYQKLIEQDKLKRIITRPGEILPIGGMKVQVISADGDLIEGPLSGAGKPNAVCQSSQKYPADRTENARSLGVLLTFGKLRILDLGDLTQDKEMELMCPANKLGHVDIFVVSHHGWYQSNSPALVHGIAPRVAVMDNGAKKGGTPSTWEIIEKSPGLEDLWQLHYSEEGGAAHNVSDQFIANLQGTDAGNFLKLTAWADGGFEVTNSGTNKTKRYAPKVQ